MINILRKLKKYFPTATYRKVTISFTRLTVSVSFSELKI